MYKSKIIPINILQKKHEPSDQVRPVFISSSFSDHRRSVDFELSAHRFSIGSLFSESGPTIQKRRVIKNMLLSRLGSTSHRALFPRLSRAMVRTLDCFCRLAHDDLPE